MADDHTPLLVEAVSRLTVAVEKLDHLLRDDYPKRSEVEKKYVSKLENQKVVTKVILLALITVLVSYVSTVGAYSQCFVGTDSPGVCKFVPGYEQRIDRLNEIDNRFAELEEVVREQREQQTRPRGKN